MFVPCSCHVRARFIHSKLSKINSFWLMCLWNSFWGLNSAMFVPCSCQVRTLKTIQNQFILIYVLVKFILRIKFDHVRAMFVPWRQVHDMFVSCSYAKNHKKINIYGLNHTENGQNYIICYMYINVCAMFMSCSCHVHVHVMFVPCSCHVH